MPDEQSNLNLPAAARRPAAGPAGRRRGRRGGRGRSRGPRPTADKSTAVAGELPPHPEPAEEAVVRNEETIAEPERDTSGDFREPHLEEPVEAVPPEEFSHSDAGPVAESAAECVAEIPAAPEPERERERQPEPERQPERERQPEHQRQPERPARPEYRRPEPKPWVKPADFRPAETSAISQAVAHATEIAESLKHTIDQLDEILELVELAERQKLADEREIDELRRALRRIQPPRQQQQLSRGPRHDEPHRGHRDQGPRHDDRHARHDPRENIQRHEDPRPPEAGEPPPHAD